MNIQQFDCQSKPMNIQQNDWLVPYDAKLVKVASPSLSSKWLLEADYNRSNTISVPYRAEDLVGKSTDKKTKIQKYSSSFNYYLFLGRGVPGPPFGQT